jgi:hypothetical protein
VSGIVYGLSPPLISKPELVSYSLCTDLPCYQNSHNCYLSFINDLRIVMHNIRLYISQPEVVFVSLFSNQ